MLSSVLVAICVICILFLIANHRRNHEFYKLASRFPGPFSLPITGCMHLLFGNSERIYKTIFKYLDSYPSPFRVWLGSRLFITVSTPEEARTILLSRNSIEKDDFYKFFEPWMGQGIFIAEGDLWRVHRKLIQPAFHQNVLNSFVDIFQKYSVILNKELENEANGAEFPLKHRISNKTLNIVLESAMGVEAINKDKIGKKYFEAVEQILTTISSRVFKLWLQIDCIFYLTRLSKQYETSIKYVHNVTDDIIKTKREIMERTAAEEIEVEARDGFINEKKPFLDLLMKLSLEGKIFTDTEIRDEINTLLFGGHDTSASTITFTMLMLASHPDIQDKVYQEIHDIYGTKDPEEIPVKPEDLPKLIYLERVIKETLRLFSPAAFIIRKVEENLNLGKHVIPKGAAAIIAIIKIHRDEKLWPEPLKFNPDRFLPEEIAKRHHYSYLPFSGGPRNCIGQTFAMMSMKTILSAIIRKFILKKDKIESIKDIRLKVDVLLQPVLPITIRLENRIVK